jgi:hypothetical protein
MACAGVTPNRRAPMQSEARNTPSAVHPSGGWGLPPRNDAGAPSFPSGEAMGGCGATRREPDMPKHRNRIAPLVLGALLAEAVRVVGCGDDDGSIDTADASQVDKGIEHAGSTATTSVSCPNDVTARRAPRSPRSARPKPGTSSPRVPRRTSSDHLRAAG